MLYLEYLLFWCYNSLLLFLFMNSLWFFFFLTPSSKVLWYLWLYLLLLSYSTSKVLRFLNLNFLLLSYPIRPYLSFFILARYHCICWTTTNENWKFFLISFQLVLQKKFISFMLSQILLQLLYKIFLCNLPPFFRFCLKVLQLFLHPH